MKNETGRKSDCTTAYPERTGQAARHTEKWDHSRNTFRIWKRLSPEGGKQLVSQGRTGALHAPVWLFPVVTQLRLCRTLQRNWLLLATGISLVEFWYLGMPGLPKR